MTVSELHRQIADAVLAGARVDAIEQAIIDPAPLDEEHKSALWLYAQALQDRTAAGLARPQAPHTPTAQSRRPSGVR
jgi:hypothetical protein